MASAGIWASSFHRLFPHFFILVFFFFFFFDRLVKQACSPVPRRTETRPSP